MATHLEDVEDLFHVVVVVRGVYRAQPRVGVWQLVIREAIAE